VKYFAPQYYAILKVKVANLELISSFLPQLTLGLFYLPLPQSAATFKQSVGKE